MCKVNSPKLNYFFYDKSNRTASEHPRVETASFEDFQNDNLRRQKRLNRVKPLNRGAFIVATTITNCCCCFSASKHPRCPSRTSTLKQLIRSSLQSCGGANPSHPIDTATPAVVDRRRGSRLQYKLARTHTHECALAASYV